MTARVHTCSTSCSRCELRKTVVPGSAEVADELAHVLSCRRGSRPLVGLVEHDELGAVEQRLGDGRGAAFIRWLKPPTRSSPGRRARRSRAPRRCAPRSPGPSCLPSSRRFRRALMSGRRSGRPRTRRRAAGPPAARRGRGGRRPRRDRWWGGSGRGRADDRRLAGAVRTQEPEEVALAHLACRDRRPRAGGRTAW